MKNIKRIKKEMCSKSWYWLLGAIFFSCSSPQPTTLPKIIQVKDTTQKYNFVRYEANAIYQPKANTLAHIYTQLQQLAQQKDRQVNIVHFGDSHIQADFFTNQIRQSLQNETQWGNGGRGYFFPCGLATKSYDPVSIKLSKQGEWEGCRNIQTSKECNWGLAGMTAQTNDSEASFEVSTRGTHTFDKVRLYYTTTDESFFQVRIWDGLGFLSPHRIYKNGYAEFLLSQPVKKIGVCMQRNAINQGKFVLEGISLDQQQAGIVYHSAGVNGAKVSSFLRSPQLTHHLQSLNPSLVVISLGTNDCFKIKFDVQEFEQSYDSLINEIKIACPQASILLTTPGDTFIPAYKFNQHTAQVVNVAYHLAEKYNVAIWDLYKIMGGYGSIAKWEKQNLAGSDRVHFTRSGYRLQGDLFYKAFVKGYREFVEK